MTARKLLIGAADPGTGFISHQAFSSGDILTDPVGNQVVPAAWFYGNGELGDVIISSDTFITTASMYNNFTIADGVTVTITNYIFMVKGTLTLGNGARIIRAPGEASGLAGGAAGTQFFYGMGSTGGNGASTSGNGTAGLILSAGFGGAGGKGGNAATSVGGAGGTVSAPFTSEGGRMCLSNVHTLINGSLSSSGLSKFQGGAGGGGGAASTGTGGGGGGGGRVLVIFAHKIVVPIGTATISANGANGANGVTGNGGGGGGGGGGVCVVVSAYAQPAGLTVQAAGGTGGAGSGTGVAGAAGATGYAKYLRFN